MQLRLGSGERRRGLLRLIRRWTMRRLWCHEAHRRLRRRLLGTVGHPSRGRPERLGLAHMPERQC